MSLEKRNGKKGLWPEVSCFPMFQNSEESVHLGSLIRITFLAGIMQTLKYLIHEETQLINCKSQQYTDGK